MRPGAHSIPYYHNDLGDPLWPPKTVGCTPYQYTLPKTVGCAESSTEEHSTTKPRPRFNTKSAKPNVVLLAVVIYEQGHLPYVWLVGC